MGETFKALLASKRQLQACYQDVERLYKRVKELEKQLAPILPPKIMAQITMLEVYEMLIEVGIPSEHIYLSDSVFDITTEEEIGRFLAWDETDELHYTPRLYDCENFTRRLLGNISIPGWARIAFGKAWGDVGFGEHALNISIHHRNGVTGVFYLEAQTDEIKPLIGQFRWAEI